jgi:hypothetical protein
MPPPFLVPCGFEQIKLVPLIIWPHAVLCPSPFRMGRSNWFGGELVVVGILSVRLKHLAGSRSLVQYYYIHALSSEIMTNYRHLVAGRVLLDMYWPVFAPSFDVYVCVLWGKTNFGPTKNGITSRTGRFGT